MAVRRIAVFAVAFLLVACGDHVGSVGQTIDGLGALEKDPRAVLAAAHPTYKARTKRTSLDHPISDGI